MMRRSPALLKFLSVACSVMMLLTVLNVCVDNAAAETDSRRAEEFTTYHSNNLLTLSEGSSGAAISSDGGVLHVAWSGVSGEGQRLYYKSSGDGMVTFTQDSARTPVMHSVANVSIASSDGVVVIAFEGRADKSSEASAFALASRDGGATWSSCVKLSEGRSPSAAIAGGVPYVSVSGCGEKGDALVIVSLKLDYTGIAGADVLAALGTGGGPGAITEWRGALYYAAAISAPSEAIVFGRADQAGRPSLVAPAPEGSVDCLRASIGASGPLVAWSSSIRGSSAVAAATSADGAGWSVSSLAKVAGPSSVSVSALQSGWRVAWDGFGEVLAAEVSAKGRSGVSVRLSTEGVASSGPALAVLNGTPVAVWTEAHAHRTELVAERPQRPEVERDEALKAASGPSGPKEPLLYYRVSDLPGMMAKVAALNAGSASNGKSETAEQAAIAPVGAQISPLGAYAAQNDAGQGADAPSSSTASGQVTIVPGPWSGSLISSSDTSDWYKFTARAGQTITVRLDEPSGFKYTLSIMSGSTTKATAPSQGAGVQRTVSWTATADGTYHIKIAHSSGTGQGQYSFLLHLSVGQDYYYLDLDDVVSDSQIASHLTGICVTGAGWSQMQGEVDPESHRQDSYMEAASGSSFLLNLESPMRGDAGDGVDVLKRTASGDIFHDDFDDGDVSDWWGSGISVSGGAIRALRTTINGDFYAAHDLPEVSGTFYIKVDIRFSNDEPCYLMVSDSNYLPAIQLFAWMGYIWYNDGQEWRDAMDVYPNIWYTIGLKVNSTDGTYVIYIDGDEKVEAPLLENGALTSIKFVAGDYGCSPSATVWADNVQIFKSANVTVTGALDTDSFTLYDANGAALDVSGPGGGVDRVLTVAPEVLLGPAADLPLRLEMSFNRESASVTDVRGGDQFTPVVTQLLDRSNTDYLLSFKYMSTGAVPVQVSTPGGWVTIGTLPGTSAWGSWSLLLSQAYVRDSLPDAPGTNVMLRLGAAAYVDEIGAVAYSYEMDVSDIGMHKSIGPSIWDNWAWSEDGETVSGNGLMLQVATPSQRVDWTLEIDLDGDAGQMVQMLTSANQWVNLSALHKFGQTASVYLDMHLYSDGQPGLEGLNVMLRIDGEIIGIRHVRITPSVVDTNIGDEAWNANLQEVDPAKGSYALGITILDNGCWSDYVTVGDASGRRVLGAGGHGAAYLHLNSPLSGLRYRMNIYISATAAGAVWQWTGTEWASLGSIDPTGQLGQQSFWTLAGDAWGHYDDDVSGDAFLTTTIKIESPNALVCYILLEWDTDGDAILDNHEAQGIGASSYVTDHRSADTDGDGLSDWEEIFVGSDGFVTDPLDPDCDDDGLMDGEETWSYAWASEMEYRVVNGAGDGGRAAVPIVVPTLSPNSVIESVQVVIGVQTDRAQDIQVTMKKGLFPEVTVRPQSGNGANVFEAVNALSGWYLVSSFRSGGTFYFYVMDWDDEGNDGHVQYIKLIMTGRTSPLAPDCDNDGLSDLEEITLGEDGFITCPWATDTDGDGLGDLSEKSGGGPSGKQTDPTKRDTDGDGVLDGSDKAVGNLVVELDFDWMQRLYPYYSSNHGGGEVFFVVQVTVGSDTHTLFTDHVNKGDQDMGATYYFDVPDDTWSITFQLQAWADSPSYILLGLGGDDQLEFNGSSNCESRTFNLSKNYYANDQALWAFRGNELNIDVYARKVVEAPVTTIVVHGDGADGAYGLEALDGGKYRWTADEQAVVLHIECVSGGSSNWLFPSTGKYNVVVPRSVAMASNLSWYLADPINRMTSSTWAGGLLRDKADISFSDTGDATAPGGLAMALSVSGVTRAEAKELVSMLMYAKDSSRVGRAVTMGGAMSGPGLYLLGLPPGVIQALQATSHSNSRMEGPPQGFWDNVENWIVAGSEFLVDGVVFLLDVIEAAAAAVGKAVFDTMAKIWAMGQAMTSAISDALSDAADKVAGAFDAFIDWATALIEEIIRAAVDAPLNAVMSLADGFRSELARSAMSIANDMSAAPGGASGTRGSDVSEASVKSLENALEYGGVIQALLSIGLAISVGMLAFQAITGGGGFLISHAVEFAAMFIMAKLMAQATGWSIMNELSVWNAFKSALAFSNLNVNNMGIMSAAVESIVVLLEGKVLAITAALGLPTADGLKSFALGIIGLILCIWSAGMAPLPSLIVSVIGLVISGVGLMKSFTASKAHPEVRLIGSLLSLCSTINCAVSVYHGSRNV